MDANTCSLEQILQQERRFVVPTFQRDHEWTEGGQRELLFDDFEVVADRLAEARRSATRNGSPVSSADKHVAPHFLGAIVLDQFPSPAGGIDLRAVIDGHQRLTTLQARQERDRAVRRIGNLPLVTSTFNQAVSNAPWPIKLAELAEHSKLQINSRFAAMDHWDEETHRGAGAPARPGGGRGMAGARRTVRLVTTGRWR